MAKIDSVGKMRLPPDSALRPHAYSERERATSEPTKRALTEWFQVVQQQRQGQTDQALTRAIEAALNPRTDDKQPVPRALPLTVVSALTPTQPGRHDYSVQLGQQLVRISSSTLLQPGQTLLLTPTPQGPQLLVPNRPDQSHLMLAAAQRHQLSLLPAVQVQTAVSALLQQLPDLARLWLTVPAPAAAQPTTAAVSNVATPATEPPSTTAQKPADAAIVASGSNKTGPTTSSVSALTSGPLRDLLMRWAESLPSVRASAPTSTASPTSGPTPASVLTGDASTLKNSQHWITQLIQTAQHTYGKATPESVRAVWNQWQQNASALLQTPSASASPIPAPTPSPSTSQPPVAPSTVQTPAQPSGLPTGSAPSSTDITALLALPILHKGMSTAATSTTPNAKAPIHQGTPPADWWRLVAEQWIDLRLTQLGSQAPQLSLQEQLKQRAQDILTRTHNLYSPDQMRQSLSARATADPAMVREQQSLLAVRQTLEQVAQQQQVRTLLGLPNEPSGDTSRILHSIPVWSDQHLVWFDLERHATEQDNDPEKKQMTEWVLDIHFHLAPMAPICARLHWRDDQCSVHFLTDDAATLRSLHQSAPQFSQRMSALSLPVEDVQCRHGLPKRAANASRSGTVSSHQVDIRT